MTEILHLLVPYLSRFGPKSDVMQFLIPAVRENEFLSTLKRLTDENKISLGSISFDASECGLSNVVHIQNDTIGKLSSEQLKRLRAIH